MVCLVVAVELLNGTVLRAFVRLNIGLCNGENMHTQTEVNNAAG